MVVWRKSDLEAEIGIAIHSHMRTALGTQFSYLVQPQAGKTLETPIITIDRLEDDGQPKVLRSVLDADDVKEISRNTIDGFKHDLELVPHYMFRYSCSYVGKDGSNVEVEGIVWVNALTGKYGSWDKEPELDQPKSHKLQLEPKIDSENARKIAIQAISFINTEFKEVIVERDHATIIEKATFKPESGSIDIGAQTLVLVPVWCVEGKHGVMILDGITGKIISEDYYEKR